jgi:hypothetical protein
VIGRVPGRRESVFINVPFDRQYRKLFHALVFTVHDCGFVSRCALESADGSETRMNKLYDIIEACPLGIHDLSRTTLDAGNRLPRFNMPLELGLFLGAKRYGRGAQRKKSCLILEKERYRYQKFCSDIAGQDIRAHGNTVEKAIGATRDWLRAARSGRAMASGATIASRYVGFRLDAPRMCRERGLDFRDLPFLDYRTLVVGWQAENADVR